MKRPLSWCAWRRGELGPATFWVRLGHCGRGLHVRYRMRPDDYRPFSERQGLTHGWHIGPLTVRGLAPYRQRGEVREEDAGE
jgi:hypothetical protein